jgi:hypothetical protein
VLDWVANGSFVQNNDMPLENLKTNAKEIFINQNTNLKVMSNKNTSEIKFLMN